MPFSTSTLPCLLALLMLVGSLEAQSFEGVIRQRSLMVSDDALFEMMYAAEEEDVEYEDEDAYNQATAFRLFDMPYEQLQSMAASSAAESGEVTVRIRGERIRVEMGAGGAHTITDLQSGTMWMINPESRTYMEFSKADAEAAQRKAEEMMSRVGIAPEGMEEAGSPEGAVTVTDLEQTRTINGFQARGFRASSKEEYGEAWCSSDAFGLAAALQKIAEQAEEMTEEADGAALEDEMCSTGLPVLSKAFYPYADIFEVSEILSVEPGPQSPEMFEIPEGFARVEMSEIWK